MQVANVVRRINEKLATSDQFLVAKYRGGVLIGYCLANGRPDNAKYEPVDSPVDVNAMARRLGIRP